MAYKNSSFIDIRKFLKLCLRYWYLFVVSVVCCLAVGFVATRVFKEKAGVRANILIREEEKSPLASMGSLGDIFGSSSNVDDEIFVISSHSLYRDLIKELQINKMHYVRQGFLNNVLTYPDFPLDVTFDPSIADTLSVGLRFNVAVGEDGLADMKVYGRKGKKIATAEAVKLPYTFKLDYGDFTVERTKDFPIGEKVKSKILVYGYNQASEILAEKIRSDIPSKRTNIITLAIDYPNAVMGVDILQTLIDKYNERGIREDNVERTKTAEFISSRLNSLGKELSDAEIEIQKFKERHGITDVTIEVDYQSTKLGRIEQELITSEAALEVLKLTCDYVSDPKNAYELIPAVMDNTMLNTFINEYNDKLVERNNLLRTVSPNNQAVENLTAIIDATRHGILNSLNQAYKNQSAVVADLKRQISNTKSDLRNLPEAERQYVDMNRERMLKSEIYTYLLGRQEENSMMIANASEKGIIVDEPYVLADPIGPSPKLIMIVFLLIGLCLPPIALYVIRLLRDRVESREEVERRITTPILGEMCIDKSGRNLVVSKTDTSSATELFRLMRANLLFVLNGRNEKVVLVTSSKSGEGKSFISINLAASLALIGKKVLVIGMDIRAPRLASYLGVHSQYGLTQYLASESIPLNDIIIRHAIDGIPSMDVIVAGPVPPNPAELLVSNRVDEMFATLRNDYDYIIVDTAPVGMVSDTFALDRIADATIYVTRTNYSLNSDLDFIQEIYSEKRLKKLSVVINGVASKKTYGYHRKNKIAE